MMMSQRVESYSKLAETEFSSINFNRMWAPQNHVVVSDVTHINSPSGIQDHLYCCQTVNNLSAMKLEAKD